MLSNKEMSMYNARGKRIRVICKDGSIVEGMCDYFTQPLDNDPEIAEISVRSGTETLISITEPEVEKIEYLS